MQKTFTIAATLILAAALPSCELFQKKFNARSADRSIVINKRKGEDLPAEKGGAEGTAQVKGRSSIAGRSWNAAAPRLSIQNSHTDSVTDIGYSADGSLMATGSKDNTVRLWNNEGILINILEGHSSPIEEIRFCPDGSLLAAASEDGFICLWNRNGDLKARVEGSAPFEFRADGRVFASNSKGDKIYIRKTDGTLVHSITKKGELSGLAYVPGGMMLAVQYYTRASGDGNRNVYFFDEKANLTKTIEIEAFKWGFGKLINRFRFGPDGRSIAVWTRYDISWHRAMEGEKDTFRRTCSSILVFSIDGDSGVLLRHNEIASGRDDWIANITSVDFSPDGKYLVSGALDGTIKLWKRDGTLVREISKDVMQGRGGGDGIWSVRFSPDGDTIVTSDNSGRGIHMWNSEGKFIKTVKMDDAGIIANLLFSPDGRKIIFNTNKGSKIYMLDNKGSPFRTLEGKTESIATFSISPDGDSIAAALSGNSIGIWNVKASLFKTMKAHADAIRFLSFSPDGSYLVSGSKDDRFIIWGKDGVKIREVHALSAEPGRNNFIVSPDSAFIAYSTPEHVIRIVARNGEVKAELRGHTDSVRVIQYQKNGRILLSGSSDGSIKIWDAGSGECLATLLFFLDGSSLVYTPDGRFDYSHASAKQYVSYVMGERFIDLNDIFDQYYTPGLLTRIMGGTLSHSESAALGDLFTNLPRIEIRYPPAGSSDRIVDGHEERLIFRVRDGGGGVSRGEVRVNGKLVWQSGEGTDFGKEVIVTVPLSQGPNRVTVTAYNEKGGPVTERADIPRRVMEAKKESRLYILSVGTDAYSRNRLQYAVKDARAMVKEFERGGRSTGLFAEVSAKLLVDATKKGIQDEVTAITKAAGPDDVVILYFSGHGMSVRDRSGERLFAYIPADFPWRGDDVTVLRRFGVEGDWIAERIREGNAQKVVLIFDCCQSGDMQAALAGARSVGASNEEMLERLAVGTGIFLMASSAGSEVSRENPDIGHGLFTHVLLQGLRSRPLADYDKDGVVTVKELSTFVDMTFDRELRRIMGKEYLQTPVVNSMGRGEMSSRVLDFPIAK